MDELVTAVITTYKREPEIVERALKSILAQTYPNLEIIVVDDSPSDYSFRNQVAETVKKYQDYRVRYIPHETNKGACVARNTGLEAANGEYIGYLDDDDEWLPEKTARQVAAFERCGHNVGLVYCDNLILDQITGKEEYRPRVTLGENAFQMLLNENYIGGASMPLIRTEALKAVGGFDIHLQAAQDHDMWLRIVEKYQVEHVKAPLMRYYIHPGEQITSNPKKRVAGMERFVEKYEPYLIDNNYACWRIKMKLAWDYADAGNKRKAILMWIRYLWKCPLQIKENIRYLYVILR